MATSPKPLTNRHVSNEYVEYIGQTVVIEGVSFVIKQHVKCRDKQYFALETQQKLTRSVALCPTCSQRHVEFPAYRGFYQTVDNILRAIERQKATEQRRQTPPDLEHETCVTDNQPPLTTPLTGQNKGIEGDSNSCYIDATIFCMFPYSDVFDRLLHMKVDDNLTVVQRILRDYIVNVLRQPDGLVRGMSTINALLRVCLTDILPI